MNLSQTHLTYSGEALTSEELQKFDEQGYLGPYTLVDTENADLLLKKLRGNLPNQLMPLVGRHTVIREVAELTKNPIMLDKITNILGEDVILWGSHIFEQKPSARHHFHVDVEFAEIEGITVWLALKNVVSEESFSIIPGSHLFNVSPQELKCLGVDVNNDKALEEAAKRINPQSKILPVKIKDGQFIILKGLLWHSTKNRTTKARFAINFRFSRPSADIRIAKNENMTNIIWHKNKPVCLLINGVDRFNLNRLKKINTISIRNSLLKCLFVYFPRNVARSIFNHF